MTMKFKQERILIVGCGDVGLRILPLIRERYRIFALTSQPQRCSTFRAAGAIPVIGDLDEAESLYRLAGLAPKVLHLAPPQNSGDLDLRTRRLLPALGRVKQLVYVSTTGVYGDCDGAQFDETRPFNPQTQRAVRRVDAERHLRLWALQTGAKVSILRVPGIYAADRLPLDRLRAGTPALMKNEDVYTNHIHADDLARMVVDALHRASPQRVYHASDDSNLRMGEYFDAVADAFKLARPPRLSRAELVQQVSPTLLSFMSESRRLRNQRIKLELGSTLRYPNVADFLEEFKTKKSNRQLSLFAD